MKKSIRKYTNCYYENLAEMYRAKSNLQTILLTEKPDPATAGEIGCAIDTMDTYINDLVEGYGIQVEKFEYFLIVVHELIGGENE